MQIIQQSIGGARSDMALPHRRGFAYVLLGNKEASLTYPPGSFFEYQSITTNLIDTYPIGNRPGQSSFYSYVHYFKGYPSEVVAKKIRPAPMDNQCWANDNFNWIYFGIEATRKETYPDNIVYQYDPSFPIPNDPPPDPNGTTSHFTQDYPWAQIMVYPRWVDWDAYDFSSSGVSNDYYSGSIVPKPDFEYGQGSLLGLPSVNMSYRFTITNLLSIVRNEENGYDEYYPFECAESIFENQAIIKFGPPIAPTGFCWNDGTVIRGKIAFSSIDVTCTPFPQLGQTEYGYGGFKAKTGSTFSPHSEEDWEVTIESGAIYGPPIDIPQEDNMIIFVNDFWVTEVIPPGG